KKRRSCSSGWEVGNAAFAVSFIFLYITTGQSVSSKLVVNFLCNVQKVKEYQGFWTLIGVLPWHTKSTLIIVLFLLVLPRNALFCKGFREFCCWFDFALKCVIVANQSKVEHVVTTC